MPRTSLIASLLLVLGLFCGAAFAHPRYQQAIPNGAFVLGGIWPGVGHMNPAGGGDRNPFGLDFAAHGYSWTRELCLLDSDLDGISNGQELGDPDCVWTPGSIPQRTQEITHPGFPEGSSLPTAVDTCANLPPEGKDVLRFNMTMSNYTIPAKETTYACQKFDMPAKVNSTNNQIIRFDAFVNRADLVHHLTVYRCRPDAVLPVGPWECGLDMPAGCTEFVWGWAPGALSECLPEQAGVPVGLNGPKYFVMQIHYNNDQRISGATDSTSVQLHITSRLRQYDAAVLDSGISEANIAIPPQLKQFELTSDCPGFCTQQTFPHEGVFVYGYLMHMHLLGSKMWTEIIYVNGSRAVLGQVDNYNFYKQLWVPVRPVIKLSRGDALLTHCVWDSTSRNSTTVGGPSSTDEMCTANIAYYPRLPGFNLCTNYTDDDGEEFGRCGTFDFNWTTGARVPICDITDVPREAAAISTEVLPKCSMGQACSGLCKEAILTFARTTGCVIRIGLNATLSNCGQYQQDCNEYRTLFESACMSLCYTGEPAAHNNCYGGRECNNFLCTDYVGDKTIAIVTIVTIASLIILIGAAILVIVKCHRFQRKRVEYVG